MPKAIRLKISCVERKPAFCICEIKGADQLHSNRAADQRLCFRYIDSTIPLLPKLRNFMQLAIFCGCTVWFVLNLVGNALDRLSHDVAHIGLVMFQLSEDVCLELGSAALNSLSKQMTEQTGTFMPLRKFLIIDSVISVNLFKILFLSLVLNIYKKIFYLA